MNLEIVLSHGCSGIFSVLTLAMTRMHLANDQSGPVMPRAWRCCEPRRDLTRRYIMKKNKMKCTLREVVSASPGARHSPPLRSKAHGLARPSMRRASCGRLSASHLYIVIVLLYRG